MKYKRTAEFVLGLIGGIFGLIFSVLAIFVGAVDQALTGSTDIYLQAIVGILASVGGIVGGIIVRSKAKAGGWLMIVSGVVGTIAIGLFYLISLILLLIGGIMGVARKDEPTVSA